MNNLRVTFSKNCRTGWLARCECWRCREARHEPHDATTEALAEKQTVEADRRFRAARDKALAALRAIRERKQP